MPIAHVMPPYVGMRSREMANKILRTVRPVCASVSGLLSIKIDRSIPSARPELVYSLRIGLKTLNHSKWKQRTQRLNLLGKKSSRLWVSLFLFPCAEVDDILRIIQEYVSINALLMSSKRLTWSKRSYFI